MAETDPAVDVQGPVVRPAARQARVHARDGIAVGYRTIETQFAAYTAHIDYSSPPP